MLLLSDLDILFLKAALAGSVAYGVQHVASHVTRKGIQPLIPDNNTTQQTSRIIETPTRSIKQRLAQTSKSCVIFYGSQTGTAEKLASILSKEARTKFGIECLVANLEDFDYDDLLSLPKDKVAIFVLATYGEGEPTDNALSFDQYCNSLQKEQTDPAPSLRYAAFGLGSSSYQQFNSMIKRTDSSLGTLGAQRLGDIGFGDDGKGSLEDDFLAWKETTLPILALNLGLSERESRFEATFDVKTLGPPTVDTFLGEPNKAHLRGKIRGPYSASNPLPAPLVHARQIFTSGDRRCLHIEFDIGGSTMSYESGDHLAVWPSNSNIEVARFLRVFGLTEKKDAQISIQSLDPTVKIPIPVNTTYEAAARYYIDICAPVSRHILALLAEFVVDGVTRSRLQRLSSDSEILQKEVRAHHLNLAQLIESISCSVAWNELPFSLILEYMPKLRPRYYSISSSALASRKRISITGVIETRKLPGWKHEFKGVATNYLLSQALKHDHALLGGDVKAGVQFERTHDLSGPRDRHTNPMALIHVRRSKFHLPSDVSIPVIMIGPGTGVAPFRAFTQERAFQSRQGKIVGRTVLFYGCRRQDEDFLYQSEWKELAESFPPMTFNMHVAFSRESSKVYVQDLIRKQAEEIKRLVMEQGAFIYVCGDAKRMAKDVFKTMVEVLAGYKLFNGSTQEAELYLKDLKRKGRWSEDVW